MNYFRRLLDEEIEKEEKLLNLAKVDVLKAPEGRIVTRKRKSGISYYQRIGGKDINKPIYIKPVVEFMSYRKLFIIDSI